MVACTHGGFQREQRTQQTQQKRATQAWSLRSNHISDLGVVHLCGKFSSCVIDNKKEVKMSRGLRSVFESGAPALMVAVVMLIAAIAYGVHTNRNAPTPEAPAVAPAS